MRAMRRSRGARATRLLDDDRALDHVHPARVAELAGLRERGRELDGCIERQLLLDLLAAVHREDDLLRAGLVGLAREHERDGLAGGDLDALRLEARLGDRDLDLRAVRGLGGRWR